jgi:hypothetical protein
MVAGTPERKILLTIKQRAERLAQAGPWAGPK